MSTPTPDRAAALREFLRFLESVEEDVWTLVVVAVSRRAQMADRGLAERIEAAVRAASAEAVSAHTPWLRAVADEILEADVAVIESGGQPNAWRGKCERALRLAADEIENLRAQKARLALPAGEWRVSVAEDGTRTVTPLEFHEDDYDVIALRPMRLWRDAPENGDPNQ